MRMRMRKTVGVTSFLMTGLLAVGFLCHRLHIEYRREQAIMCMAENLYHEGRGEQVGHQYLLGMLTLARVADPDPQWPKTICGVVGQDRQFSWTLDYRLATKRGEQEKWEKAKFIARDLVLHAWVRFLLPRGWACARFYKRTDGKGVSKKSQKFFDARLFPVGQFGSHSAFQERRGCKYPLPTT